MKTTPDSDTKICRKCLVDKDKHDFYFNKHSKDLCSCYCRSCIDRIAKQHRKDSRQRAREELLESGGVIKGRGRAKSYQLLNEEEKLAADLQKKLDWKAYSKEYHHQMNKAISAKNKELRLQKLIEKWGSVEVYEKHKRLQANAKSQAYRDAKKALKQAAEENAKILKVFDCMDTEESGEQDA